MNSVLIVGANFKNKGAQSMLFSTVSSVREVNKNTEIYFATTEAYQESDYTFKRIYYSHDAREIALESNSYKTLIKRIIKDFAKTIIGRTNGSWRFMDLKNIMPQINLIIDISGFALGDKWPSTTHELYLDGIRLAKKYEVPIILMPQSFGPFNYTEDKKYLLSEISELLPYPDVIFTREKEGYDLLKEKFSLTNVKLSSDLVLQSQRINTDLVFNQYIEPELPLIKDNAVAVIPNNECFRHGDKEEILGKYQVILSELLNAEKEIYVLHHSSYDADICREIFAMFKDNRHVHLLENDFSCIEFDEIVKQFQFIICSRYHGIVHAYLNNVPCIILGWAVKYVELAKTMSQGQYVFNLIDGNESQEKVVEMTINMLSNYQKEKLVIEEKLKLVQQDNCFEILKRYL